MLNWRKGGYWVACVGGLGLSPYAPGTVGSLAAVALYYLTHAWPFWLCVVMWFVLVFVALICIRVSLPLFSSDDPSAIVIDEVAGALLAFVYLPSGWWWMVIAFVAFRFFDIVKPWPVGWFDANVKGANGIILDDIAAGVCAFITVQLIYAGSVIVNGFF